MNTKNAIERIKTRFDKWALDDEDVKAIQTLIPELKESEDEKIRKGLIAMLSQDKELHHNEIAYLEKQKVNVKDKVKVLSWRSPDDCSDIPEGHYVVIEYCLGGFGLGYIANGKVISAPGNKPQAIFYIPNADESVVIKQKPAEFSEEDRENFEWFDKFFRAESVIAGGRDIPQDKYLWFKSLRPQPKREWSEEDKVMLNNIICGVHMKSIKSLDEMDDRSKYKKYEDFLKSLPTRFSLQPKAVWSEEDSQILEEAIGMIGANGGWMRSDDAVKQVVNFLKSLPERFNLQPKQAWSQADETAFNDLMWCIEQARKSAKDENDMGNIWFAERWVNDRLKYIHPQLKQEDRYMEGYIKGFADAEKGINNGVSYPIDNPNIYKLDPNVVIDSTSGGTNMGSHY